MVRSGSPMLQNITKTMSVLLILPLLLAHRHPTQARHPKASILRRMPIFYGKRDPALASPPDSALSAVPASPYLYPAGVKAVPEDYMDKHHHGSPARAGPGERQRGLKTGKRGDGGGGSGGAGDGRRPPWMASSVLLTRMEDHLHDASRSEGSANIFRNGARAHNPQFNIWRQFRQSGDDGEDRQPAFSGPGERLRKKLKRLSATLARKVDTRHDVLQSDEEDASYLMPVKMNTVDDDDGYVGDTYNRVWSDNTGMPGPDGGADDYLGSDDDDFLVEIPGIGGEEDMW